MKGAFGLHAAAMSAIMTDMKTKNSPRSAPLRDTFTVRDMNRQPQVVLTAARKLGRVHIQGRSGERFVIQPAVIEEAQEPSHREDFLAHLHTLHQKIRESGYTGFTPTGWETFSKAIAGE